jgi:hypothetical protein
MEAKGIYFAIYSAFHYLAYVLAGGALAIVPFIFGQLVQRERTKKLIADIRRIAKHNKSDCAGENSC